MFKSLKLRVITVIIFMISKEGSTFQWDQNEKKQINVGLIFEETNGDFEKVFQKAIEDVNQEKNDFNFQSVATNFTYGNSFEMSKKLCTMLRSGIAVLFGQVTAVAANHAISICDAKELPYVDTRWDFSTELPIINLHPHPGQLALALRDLVVELGWRDFTILYESGDFLGIVNELLEMYDNSGPVVTVRRYELNINGNYRSVLQRIKRSSDNSIVIVGSVETLPELLKQAQQVGLLTDAYRYIIGNLDFHSIDIEPFQHSEVNITSLRMVNPEDPRVFDILKTMVEPEEDPFRNITCPLTINMALLYDAVQLLSETYNHLIFEPPSLDCDDDSTWDKGYTLVNYLKSSSVRGITGEIEFDHQGLRKNFELDAVELTTSGIMKIGTWNTQEGLTIERKYVITPYDLDTRSLVNKTFIVMTSLTDPYGMLKNTSEKLTGNDQYEGFGIELIQELSRKLGFSYIFRIQEDSAYGNLDKETGEWNGMIREILEDRADLAITDLTMTSDRESAVDFTIPFMTLGISILYKKPMKEKPDLFSFMSPFSSKVWLYLGIAYLSVSLSLFVLGRLSPAEWDNPYPCIQEPTELENQFSFANSLWFTMGSILQQGSEIAPKASSTRTVASMWWFFTLIMVSSYTANLAAFLTVESLKTPIENVEDLANQKGGVKYGAKHGGSTYAFFRDATYPTYKKMFQFMKDHPELQPKQNDKGVEMVEKSNYAFLMESTSIEYTIERKCNLTQVGQLLDEKGYGIAMRKNWGHRDVLSQAVLELQEQGVLAQMKTKWWKEKRGGGACAQSSDQNSAKGLGMANLGGVYFVLLIGSCLASFYGILEWLFHTYNRSRKLKVPFTQELISEIKFIIQCSGNTKEVKQVKSESGISRHSSVTVNSIESAELDSKMENDEDNIHLTNQR